MSLKTITKPLFIWDWDEEERWLNEMSAQGWHFVKYSFPFRYTFEQGKPGAYQYQLQAMEHGFATKETQEYLAFLRDMNIELIDSYLFWAYFRKPNDGQPFKLFSDVESKMKHMRRFSLIPALCTILLAVNIIFFAPTLLSYGGFWGGFLVALEAILLLLMVYGVVRMHVKYVELSKQKQLHE